MSVFDFQGKNFVCLLMVVALLVILCVIGVLIYGKLKSIDTKLSAYEYRENTETDV